MNQLPEHHPAPAELSRGTHAEEDSTRVEWVDPDAILSQDVPSIRGALRRYQAMAWIVGVLLVVLVCVGMPLKYFADNDSVVTWTGVPHGWLYMLLLITAVDLGRRVRWPWGRLALIALAGTVPFLSFVAERSATRDVRRRLESAVQVSPEESADV